MKHCGGDVSFGDYFLIFKIWTSLCLECWHGLGRLVKQSPSRWRSMMREARYKQSSFFWPPMLVVFSQ